jgi:uncharacterized membrane protein YagU involved in acid resistance
MDELTKFKQQKRQYLFFMIFMFVLIFCFIFCIHYIFLSAKLDSTVLAMLIVFGISTSLAYTDFKILSLKIEMLERRREEDSNT